MPSSLLFMLLIFASLCALAGVFLLRIGIQGKRISSDPHCRKCRFDLGGLDLSTPTKCPECGAGVSDTSKTIRDGLYKKRPWIIALAIMFLVVSATGFAWPKLSKLPSVQSVDVYDYFPESLLVRLATSGDRDALQTLHERLIPNEISDIALQSLIKYAFKHQADQTTPWDKQWGDVLLYANLSDKMSHEQSVRYIQGAFEFEVYMHPEIDRETDNVSVVIESSTSKRGAGDFGFRNKWNRAINGGRLGNEIDTPYQFDIVFGMQRISEINSKERNLGAIRAF